MPLDQKNHKHPVVDQDHYHSSVGEGDREVGSQRRLQQQQQQLQPNLDHQLRYDNHLCEREVESCTVVDAAGVNVIVVVVVAETGDQPQEDDVLVEVRTAVAVADDGDAAAT